MGISSMRTLTIRDGNPDRIRVLIYHRIYPGAPSADATAWDTSEASFRRQVELMDRWGYGIITFNDYRLYLKGEISLPKKPVIITFDDGYEEVYDIAYPIMKQHGMRGVIFILGDRAVATNAWDEGITPTRSLLNDKQVLELHAAGFEIGAHSQSHRNLANLSKSEAWEEIYRSRISLEILLNANVLSFSYPYGITDAAVKQMTADAGYSLAVGAYSGPPLFVEDRWEIRRIRTIDSKNPLALWFQLHSIYLHYRWFWWKIKTSVTARSEAAAQFLQYGPDGEAAKHAEPAPAAEPKEKISGE
jgi:peptidoglycan/xylan/chitin deacetylase (PgdA/CDA1 family)